MNQKRKQPLSAVEVEENLITDYKLYIDGQGETVEAVDNAETVSIVNSLKKSLREAKEEISMQSLYIQHLEEKVRELEWKAS